MEQKFKATWRRTLNGGETKAVLRIKIIGQKVEMFAQKYNKSVEQVQQTISACLIENKRRNLSNISDYINKNTEVIVTRLEN